MRLTRSLDISLRILISLAENKNRQSARQLSDSLKLPFHHVAKILQTMARAGYVRTVRGRGGGVELAIPPKKIILEDVIQSIEGPVYLMECTVNRDVCHMSSGCRLRLKIREAQENMMEVFRATSISDLISGEAVSQP